jgi:hypothetical protein
MHGTVLVVIDEDADGKTGTGASLRGDSPGAAGRGWAQPPC